MLVVSTSVPASVSPANADSATRTYANTNSNVAAAGISHAVPDAAKHHREPSWCSADSNAAIHWNSSWCSADSNAAIHRNSGWRSTNGNSKVHRPNDRYETDAHPAQIPWTRNPNDIERSYYHYAYENDRDKQGVTGTARSESSRQTYPNT